MTGDYIEEHDGNANQYPYLAKKVKHNKIIIDKLVAKSQS